MGPADLAMPNGGDKKTILEEERLLPSIDDEKDDACEVNDVEKDASSVTNKLTFLLVACVAATAFYSFMRFGAGSSFRDILGATKRTKTNTGNEHLVELGTMLAEPREHAPAVDNLKSVVDPATAASRMAVMKVYLIAYGVASDHDLSEEGSPQQRALEFMAEKDALLLNLTEGGLGAPENYRFLTRFALAVLYYSTQGARWTFSMNFLSSQDSCGWYQELKYVDSSTEIRGVKCDGENNIESLVFRKSNTVTLQYS